MIYLMEQPGILEEYEDILPYFPEKRREKLSRTANLRAKSQGMLAFLLLCFGLSEEYGIERYPEMAVHPLGKPYLPEYPGIHFNFSHSDEGILCALSKGPVGADIQGRIPFREKLARRILSREEEKLVREREERLTLLWTLKESYLKYLGEGIRRDLRTLDLSDWALGKQEEDGLYLSSLFKEGYAASVFSREPLGLVKVEKEEVVLSFQNKIRSR